MLHRSRVCLFLLVLGSAVPAFSSGSEVEHGTRVEVLSTRQSALVSVNINSYRKIGNVVIEVKDLAGRTLYKEEGKALTPELVRRLDKGVFPKGHMTLLVTAKDFAIERPFIIE